MLIYKCDVCHAVCKGENAFIIADFPRRTRVYAKDTHGNKLMGFTDITFAETHFCKTCYYKLLNWTCEIEE